MKTWLITGCSSGFGQRLAIAAAQRGDRVVATARNVKTIAQMAEPFGGRMVTVPLDVTDAAAAKAAVATAVESFGGIDVLVNNAGYGLYGAIEEGTPEEYRPMFEVNVFGLIETTKAALPMLRRSGGTIVNMSSGAGIAGGGGGGFYNAAKFAVEGISEALAEELRPFGIRVLIVEPGPFRTEFLGRSITLAAKEMPEYATSSRRQYRETNNGSQAGRSRQSHRSNPASCRLRRRPAASAAGPGRACDRRAKANGLPQRYRRLARHHNRHRFRPEHLIGSRS